MIIDEKGDTLSHPRVDVYFMHGETAVEHWENLSMEEAEDAAIRVMADGHMALMRRNDDGTAVNYIRQPIERVVIKERLNEASADDRTS